MFIKSNMNFINNIDYEKKEKYAYNSVIYFIKLK